MPNCRKSSPWPFYKSGTFNSTGKPQNMRNEHLKKSETKRTILTSLFSRPSVWRLFDFRVSRLLLLLLSPPPPPLPLLRFLSSASYPRLPLLRFLSCASSPLLRPNAVQQTALAGDDGRWVSAGPPVLWLSINAVQPTAGDDGHRMSFPRPVLRLSTTSVQNLLRLWRALFRSSFAFLSPVRRTFPFLRCFRSSFPLFRLSRSYFVPLFRSAFRSSLFGRWGFPTAR